MRTDDLALELDCPYCKAEPGYWCVTKGGHTATYLHGGRTGLVQRAWSAGYHEGQVDGLDSAVAWLQKRREGYRWAMDAPLVDLAVIAWLQERAESWRRRA